MVISQSRHFDASKLEEALTMKEINRAGIYVDGSIGAGTGERKHAHFYFFTAHHQTYGRHPQIT
jgi:hypothetical protein